MHNRSELFLQKLPIKQRLHPKKTFQLSYPLPSIPAYRIDVRAHGMKSLPDYPSFLSGRVQSFFPLKHPKSKTLLDWVFDRRVEKETSVKGGQLSLVSSFFLPRPPFASTPSVSGTYNPGKTTPETGTEASVRLKKQVQSRLSAASSLAP